MSKQERRGDKFKLVVIPTGIEEGQPTSCMVEALDISPDVSEGFASSSVVQHTSLASQSFGYLF